MGGTAPRSLCLGGELPIPLRGAAIRSPTVDQKPTRRETHSISTHPWTETRSLGWLLPHLPPPTTDGPAYTAPPQWTTLIPPLTVVRGPSSAPKRADCALSDKTRRIARQRLLPRTPSG